MELLLKDIEALARSLHNFKKSRTLGHVIICRGNQLAAIASIRYRYELAGSLFIIIDANELQYINNARDFRVGSI